jgi:glutamyl-tRNA synthetase
MSTPRLRFAPSPTGYLHIGGARTALFNWLWARKTGGAFVLRIEDTDQERSIDASRAVILESLSWLGLDWDEGPLPGGADRGTHGPYTQMKRLAMYGAWGEQLVAAGKAYRCYCTRAELDAQRDAWKQRAATAGFKYPGTCRDRTDEPDLPSVIRFKADRSGEVTYVDHVFGEITTPNVELQDFVLVRSDGVPVYNFGAVVDDITMEISLVARGRDHMINTPPQILLYQAFGAPVPEFAHLPMMLAPSGEKLSKRHGAVSVTEYRDAGYAPDAVLDYLARFGWSSGDREVRLSRDELVASFDWAQCGRGDGKFDPKKFAAINHDHLKSVRLVPDEGYVRGVLPFVHARGLEQATGAAVQSALPAIRDRAQTFVQAADLLDPFLREPPAIDETAARKFLVPGAAARLRDLGDALAGAGDWTEAALEARVTAWLAQHGLALKDVGQPLRVALTGRAASPSLFEVMAILGRNTALARLARGAELAAGPAAAR